jgi:16S rRNA (uracil1498-N3)-methyltransferase
LPNDRAQTLELPEESQRHAQVLRLRVGADVELFDANGHVSSATLTALSARGATCEAQPRRAIARPSPEVHLILGLPKGDKLDNVVRMLTELGVAGIHIAACERSIPKASNTDKQPRLERLERIAREACAQSGQAYAPLLHAPSSLAECAQRAPSDATRWVLWEESGMHEPMREPGREPTSSARPEMWVVVGPEGGLAAHEVDALAQQGYAQLGLGPAILRFETAAITAAVLALDRSGRLQPTITASSS